MKKIKLFIFSLALFVIMAPSVLASASINVSSSKSSVIVGNTFNVTVKVSGSEAIGSWDYTLTYDANLLKLTSGNLRIVDYGNGSSKSASYSYTFKAIGSGTSKIGIKSYDIISYAGETSMNPSSSSATIKTMTQQQLEATYSTNANLKGLSVEGYAILPEFSKDGLEYNLTVENDISSVNIIASKADNTASVSGDGTKELVEGNNKYEIVVTAQKGNTKTYVLNIERKELEPIYIDIDGKTYSLVRKKENLPKLSTFTETTINISDTDIPALKSEITKYVVVGVKDQDGKVILYIYDDGNYQLYREISFKSLVIYPTSTKNIPKGFSEYEVTINEEVVTGYKLSEDSSFALIYGIDIESGDENLYLYDSETNSLVRYFDEYNDYLTKNDSLMLILVITFGSLFIIIFIILIIVINKKKSKKIDNKKDSKKIEEKKE